MFLEKLTIQGFKSFAHEVELVFTRELTAIVGPNGSGKSNIADSVRWVLGEQSPKLLRGKKADDVIFSGSEKRSRLSYAQVDLHLDNTDGQAPIDYKKIVVSRKIYRNGESEYLLNNTKVRLSDIQILLAKSHFGQKTYSVIGQGTIDRILTFTAAERKDFFDEATGVKQYQMKKDQAVHKLHLTHENLVQGEQVLNEILPRLRSLKRQVNRLEAKEKIELELRQLQTEYYSALTQSLERELSTLNAQLATQQQKADALANQQKKIQQQLDAQGASVGRAQEFELLTKKLAALQNEYNVSSREKTRLESSRDLDLMKAGQSDLVWLQTRLDSLLAKIAKLQVEKDEQTHEETKFAAALKNAEKLGRDSLQTLTQAQDSWQTQSPQIEWSDLETKASDLRGEQTRLDSELEQLASLEQLTGFKTRLKAFSRKLQSFLGLIKTPQQPPQEQLLKNVRQAQAAHDEALKNLQALTLQHGLTSQRLEQVRKEISDTEHEIGKLKLELQAGGGVGAVGQFEKIQKELSDKAAAIEGLNRQIGEFNQKEEGKKKQLLDWQKEYSRLQYDQSIIGSEVNKLNVEIARLETRHEDLQREIKDEFPEFVSGKVGAIHAEQHKERIQELKRQLGLIGGIEETTMDEYREVKERADFLQTQTKDLNEAIASLKKLIKELDETIAKEFNTSFRHINELFGKYFKKLFSGGSAKLILEMQEAKTEEEDEGEDGGSAEERELEEETDGKLHFESLNYNVEIVATPPGKKLTGVSMLSGGEKALTSIALISAIIATNPSPFVVLDEVDAALDEANSVRFAEIVDELSDKTQFITITHNRATMHQAKILYGVTMDEGVSHLLSVNFEEADKIAA